MADNSNPQGTGTDTHAQAEADLLAFLGDSQPNAPKEGQEPHEADAQAKPDEESEDGEQQDQTLEDPVITLPNGEEVTWKQLQEERMLKADYTQKRQLHSTEEAKAVATTARLTEQAKMIDEQSKQLENAFANTLDYAQSMIPQPPDANLALTNPSVYIHQKALHEQSLQTFQQIVNARNHMMNEMDAKAKANRYESNRLERQKLEEVLPHLKGNPQKFEEFNKNALSKLKSYGIPNVERDWDNAPASMKKFVADYLRLEGQAKAKANPQGQAQQSAPSARVSPRTSTNPEGVKTIQAFRNSGSAADARKALSSDAFDKYLK